LDCVRCSQDAVAPGGPAHHCTLFRQRQPSWRLVPTDLSEAPHPDACEGDTIYDTRKPALSQTNRDRHRRSAALIPSSSVASFGNYVCGSRGGNERKLTYDDDRCMRWQAHPGRDASEAERGFVFRTGESKDASLSQRRQETWRARVVLHNRYRTVFMALFRSARPT
jgi:hypothetical protein